VHKDFAVRFDTNAYSTPPWSIGRQLTLKADQETVSLYERHKRIVTHARSWQRKQRIELPAHQELVRKIHKKLWRDRQVSLFAALGPAAREYLNALSEANQPIKKSVQRLWAYDIRQRPLLWAIEKALDHRAYGADYIQNILYQQSSPTSPLTGDLKTRLNTSACRNPLGRVRQPGAQRRNPMTTETSLKMPCLG
jgi:sulfur relay (sulfurtransferase) DsrC/TusE family protein